jgi:hypothetical protein
LLSPWRRYCAKKDRLLDDLPLLGSRFAKGREDIHLSVGTLKQGDRVENPVPHLGVSAGKDAKKKPYSAI